MSGEGRIAVVDVGKTSTKLSVVDDLGNVLEERRARSSTLPGPPYPHLDSGGTVSWILQALRELARGWPIEIVVPVSHGAAAALLSGDELALPVMDYEFTGPDELAGGYPAPPFSETLSPRLPAGQNLGRQLHWQAARMPEAFARATEILLYPQYVGWRLTGCKASEVTSLGCHTDLWCPSARAFSSLARSRGWDTLFPPIQPAWAELGGLRPEVCAATGVRRDCRVLVGIHDSNASYLPHRTAGRPPFSVVSTGTWVVCMAAGGSIDGLDPAAGGLANVDVFGDPLPTMRFMGGRELEEIARTPERLSEVGPSDVQRIVDRDLLAGPNAGEGDALHPRERAALGILYCALRTDLCLDLVGARGPCTVEGSFVRTPSFAALLAALRRGDTVRVTEAASGTTAGAALLAGWPDSIATAERRACRAAEIVGLDDYRARWRQRLTSRVGPS